MKSPRLDTEVVSARVAPVERVPLDGMFAEVRRGWEVAELVATAMAGDPVMAWATAGIEHPVGRQLAVTNFYRLLAAHTQRHGILRTHDDPATGRPAAAALWLPPGTDRRDLYTRIVRTSQQFGQRWRHLDEALDNVRPADHHHLAALAVHPGAQGHAFGRMLMDAVHRTLDPAGAFSYTEATSPHSRDWFARQGYRVLGSIHLPDGPEVWRMRRGPSPQEVVTTAASDET